MSSSTFKRAVPRTSTRGIRSGRRVVIVGYDDSPNSRAALLHGAQQAGRDGRVIVVRALPAAGDGSEVGASTRPRRYAESVASLLTAVQGQLPAGVRFEVRVVAGPVAEALAETAYRHLTSHLVIGATTDPASREDHGVAASLRARTSIPIVTVPATSPPTPSPRARDQTRAREQFVRIGLAGALDDCGHGSFPASDPPSSWAGAPRRAG